MAWSMNGTRRRANHETMNTMLIMMTGNTATRHAEALQRAIIMGSRGGGMRVSRGYRMHLTLHRRDKGHTDQKYCEDDADVLLTKRSHNVSLMIPLCMRICLHYTVPALFVH